MCSHPGLPRPASSLNDYCREQPVNSPRLTTGDSQEPSVQFPDNSDFDQDKSSDIDDGIPFGEHATSGIFPSRWRKLTRDPEAQSHIDEETIQSTTVEITEEQARHMERAIVQDQIRVPNQTGMSGLLTASCSKGVQRYDADILDNHVGATITLDVEVSNTIDNVKMHSRRSSAWEATSCLLHSRSSFANIAGVHGEIKISSNEIDGNIPSPMSRQSQRQLSVTIDMGQGAQPSPPRCLRTRPASYLEWPLRSRSTRVWQS